MAHLVHTGVDMTLLLLAACESGLSISLALDVADDVADTYSSDAPGLLRVDADGLLVDVGPMCGERLAEPIEVYVDFGFGCLDDRKGTNATLLAWIEPAPAGWDLDVFCSLAPADGLDLTDAGPTDVLATSPDDSWPQGEASAPWRRDLSPCGGRVSSQAIQVTQTR